MTSPEYQAPTWVNEDDPDFIEGVSPDLGAGYLNQLSGAVEDHGQRLGAVESDVTTLQATALDQADGDARYILQSNANGFAPAEATATALAGKAATSANLSDLASAATARTNLGLAAAAASGKLTDLTDVTATGAAVGQVLTPSQVNPLRFGARWPSPAQHPALGKLIAGLTARATTPCRLVFAGSSTTAGNNATSVANRYVNRLVASIQAAYPSGRTTEASVIASSSATWGTLSTAAGVHGYNAGEGSTVASTYLTPGEITNVAALNPAMVLHMVGANDYSTGVPVATYKANVQAQLTALKAALTAPCVHVLVQTYARTPSGTPVAAWEEYGQALDELAAADPDNVVYVDISAPYVMLGWPGADPLNIIDTDGVHQTDAGHALMAELLTRALGIPGRPLSGPVAATLARYTSDALTVNGANLAARTSDALLGGTPKTWAGDADVLATSAGAIVRGAATTGAWFVGFTEPVADVEASIVINALPTGEWVYLDVHRTAATGAGTPDAYRLRINLDGTLVVQKRVGGAISTLANATSSAVAGDRVTFRYFKGALELRKNGVLIASATDTSLPAKGYTGIAGSVNNLSVSFSAVTVDVVT